jgi:hypothetical protein
VKLWVRREATHRTPALERLTGVVLAGDYMPAGIAVYRRIGGTKLLGCKARRKREVISE